MFWRDKSPVIRVQINLYEIVSERGERVPRELEEGLWKVGIDGQYVIGFALKEKGTYKLYPFLAITVDSPGRLRRVKLLLKGENAHQVASIVSDDTMNERFFQPISKPNLQRAYFVNRFPLERSYSNRYRYPPIQQASPSHVHTSPPSGHARPTGGQPTLSPTNSFDAFTYPTLFEHPR